MNLNDIVKLLQYDRHDLMNELQILHGYLIIDKTDMVKDKLDHLIESYVQERELLNSKAPHLILFMLQANHSYENIRITYDIDLKHSYLDTIDLEIVSFCHAIINIILKYGDGHELYHLNLTLSELEANSEVRFQSSVIGKFLNVESVKSHFENITKMYPLKFKISDKGFICNYIFLI